MYHPGTRQILALKVHRQRVMRTSGMQDNRKIEPFCQRQLRLQKPLLLRKLRIVAIPIQAYLTNSDHLCRTLFQRLSQPFEMLFRMLFNHNRM